MMKPRIFGLVAALTVSAAPVFAQTSSTASTFPRPQQKLFVSVSAGGQTQSRTLEGEFRLPVYGQEAIVSTRTGVGAGPIFDLSGGYRVTDSLGVGVGFSNFAVTGRMTGAASVPSPIFFNRPASTTIPDADAKRIERSVYFTLVAFFPVTNKVDLAVFGGPSFIHASQDLVGNATVPAGTQSITTTLQRQSANGVGGVVGVDVTYALAGRIGVGAFARYNGGSVDFSSAKNAGTGGFQIGAGIRYGY